MHHFSRMKRLKFVQCLGNARSMTTDYVRKLREHRNSPRHCSRKAGEAFGEPAFSYKVVLLRGNPKTNTYLETGKATCSFQGCHLKLVLLSLASCCTKPGLTDKGQPSCRCYKTVFNILHIFVLVAHRYGDVLRAWDTNPRLPCPLLGLHHYMPQAKSY